MTSTSTGIVNFPEIITWRITSKCPFSCDYCYGPKTIPDLDTSKVKEILSLACANGMKNIILTGGEPLLRDDFIEIIQLLSLKKINIILDTNGANFFNYNFLIDEKVSDIGIPIDSVTVGGDFRSGDNFKLRIKILKYYQNKRFRRPKIRVGTVISKKNIESLDKLAQFILNFNIDSWKLYQFIPMGILGRANKEKLAISDEDFLEAAWRIKTKYGNQQRIIISPKFRRSRAYFMLDPDGSVIVPESNQEYCYYKRIGSIFDPEIITRWQEETSQANYIDNFEQSFKLENLCLPLGELDLKIFSKALPYYQESQSYQIPHIIWMIKNALPLARKLKVDKETLMPLIILHDIGHFYFQQNPYFAETRVGHMKAGKKISLKILNSLGFTQKKQEIISNYVEKHDLWSLGESLIYKADPVLGIFNDLNFSSILEDTCFESNKKYLQLDDSGMIEFASGKSALKHHDFYHSESKKLHHNELLDKEYKILSMI